jgi:hypothetical protein
LGSKWWYSQVWGCIWGLHLLSLPARAEFCELLCILVSGFGIISIDGIGTKSVIFSKPLFSVDWAFKQMQWCDEKFYSSNRLYNPIPTSVMSTPCHKQRPPQRSISSRRAQSIPCQTRSCVPAPFGSSCTSTQRSHRTEGRSMV